MPYLSPKGDNESSFNIDPSFERHVVGRRTKSRLCFVFSLRMPCGGLRNPSSSRFGWAVSPSYVLVVKLYSGGEGYVVR